MLQNCRTPARGLFKKSETNIRQETSMYQLKRPLSIFFGLALGGFSCTSFADPAYPAKPIRLVVPFTSGGGTDTMARVVANKLAESLKGTIVIDNRPGAGGNIGIDNAAKSAPDGYTIVMATTGNLAINPALYAKMPFSPLKDLTPISTVALSPLVFVAPANSPFKSIADVVAAAKARPGEISFGSPGNGSLAHLTGELFQRAAGIKMQHIPYKGAAQAIADVMGGQIHLYLSTVPPAIAQIKGGKLRAIAVTSGKRAEDMPNVPTIDEAGYKGFDASTWYGLLAPAGTPAPIIARLNAEVNRVLKMPEVQEKMRVEGGQTMRSTPEEFSALLKKDTLKWGQVVKDSGVKND
jgi:tripartite-type tricarboxylate transporter receptor subunit TctC